MVAKSGSVVVQIESDVVLMMSVKRHWLGQSFC
jgi:hypothetical protein